MTAVLYQEWLLDWDAKLRRKERKILLFQDNFSDHIVPETLTNIHVENFEPNLTAHIQPNYQEIIYCFKAHYRAKFIQCTIDQYNSDVTPSHIYDINQLQAMCLADKAWDEVDTTTIQNCWKKAGILPDLKDEPPSEPSIPISTLIHTSSHPSHLATPSSDPIMQAESLVKAALDELESTGILQCLNRMDIKELLNPIAEAHNIFEASDKDICQVVMEAKEVHKRSESAATRAGDDDDGPIEPVPT